MRDGAASLSSSLTAGDRRRRHRGLLVILLIALCLLAGVAFLKRVTQGGERALPHNEVVTEAPGKSPEAQPRAAKAEEKRIIDEFGDLESRRLEIFGGRGELLPGAIKALKITPPESTALNEAVNKMRQKTVEDFLSRTRLEEKETLEDGSTRYHYYTRARRDRGQELRASLAQEAERILGTDRAKAVMKGIEDLELPGRGGSHDMEIQMVDHGDRKSMKCREIDPKTGESCGGRECGSIEL